MKNDRSSINHSCSPSVFQWNSKTKRDAGVEWAQLLCDCWGGGDMATTAVVLRCVRAEDCTTCVLLTCQITPMLSYKESAAKTQTEREGGWGCCQTGLRHMWLTQALAHSHAVLLWVEIVAVAGTAPVYEAHALPLAHVEVPAGHGGTAGAGLGLQGAHRCQRTAC